MYVVEADVWPILDFETRQEETEGWLRNGLRTLKDLCPTRLAGSETAGKRGVMM